MELTVPRTARCVVVGRTADATAEWYALHGYGQTAEAFTRDCLPLTGGTRLLVVPEGLSRFYVSGGTGPVGASWMTRDARDAEIRDYVSYLDAVHARLSDSVRARACHVLGFSQGAATAFRWVVLGAVRPVRLVLWGGGVPADLSDGQTRGRLTGVEVVLVNGRHDRHVGHASVEADASRLQAMGIPVRVIWFDGGHRMDPGVLGSLAS
jgi:predicted esterase